MSDKQMGSLPDDWGALRNQGKPLTGRCEPPPHRQGEDGWHWIKYAHGEVRPVCVLWLAPYKAESIAGHVFAGRWGSHPLGSMSPVEAWNGGYRYDDVVILPPAAISLSAVTHAAKLRARGSHPFPHDYELLAAADWMETMASVLRGAFEKVAAEEAQHRATKTTLDAAAAENAGLRREVERLGEAGARASAMWLEAQFQDSAAAKISQLNARITTIEAERDGLRAALTVRPWTEEERDGMAEAFSLASTKHGHYEALFAVGALVLRKRLVETEETS